MDIVQHDHVVQAIPAKRTDQPLRVWVLPRRPRRRSPNRTPNVAVGTTKKSSGTKSLRWLSRNARHVDEGGLRRRGMYFATVDTGHVRLRLPANQAHDPSRCHLITVAGSTIARACLQPVQPCERTTQNPRSQPPRRRRRSPRVRVNTPICCRSARFSSASSRRPLNSDLIVPKRARTSSHTHGTVAAQAHAVQAHPRRWAFR